MAMANTWHYAMVLPMAKHSPSTTPTTTITTTITSTARYTY